MSEHNSGPAAKTIQAVLAEFLEDQRERLKEPTFRRYRSVTELFEMSMDRYGPQYLQGEELALWERHFDAKGREHREFCELFGPEKISRNVSEFLNHFMPHKVAPGKDLLRAAGTVTRKLGKWLKDKGYGDSEEAESMDRKGVRASRNLPAAKTLSQMLAADAHMVTAPVSRKVEGRFDVRVIGESSFALEEWLNAETMTVPVPPGAAALCKPGWRISGVVGKTARGWRLLDVWNVYT